MDSNEQALSAYDRLIDLMLCKEITVEQLRLQVASKTQATSVVVLQRLLTQAQQLAPFSPLRSYITATVAHQIANVGFPFLLVTCNAALAQAALRMGQWEQVIPLFSEAQQQFESEKLTQEVAHCQLGLATAYHHLNSNTEAWTLCQPLQAIFRTHQDRKGEGETLRLLAHICREREQFEQAIELYQAAKIVFQQATWPAEMACCDQDIAYVYVFKNQYSKAEKLLAQANSRLQEMGRVVNVAYGQRILAVLFIEQGRYEAALQILLTAHKTYHQEEITEGIDACERNIANVYRKLGRLDEALQTYLRLRERYLQQAALMNVAKCDMLIAMTYEEKNAYADALDYYKSAEATCLQENLAIGAARCQLNMAAIYELQGLYDEALEMLQHAKDVFAAAKLHINVAHAVESIAKIYQITNQPAQALPLLEEARTIFVAEGMHLHTIANQVKIATLLQSKGEYKNALELLLQARKVYVEAALPLQVALCDLWLGDNYKALNQWPKALELYMQTREIFAKRALPINQARCELAMADLYRTQKNHEEASRWYTAALQTFQAGLPEWAWQAAYGLSQCHLAQGKKEEALQFCYAAMNHIHQSRKRIYAERTSGAFFAKRKHIYDTGILLAAELAETASVIAMTENGKAQTFLGALFNREFHLSTRQSDTPEVKALLVREHTLRQRLERLQTQLTLQETQLILDAKQAEPGQAGISHTWQQQYSELAITAEALQKVIERLARLRPLFMALYEPPPFSLTDFMQTVTATLSTRWRCLLYYFAGDHIVICYLDQQTARHWVKVVPEQYKQQLTICASANLQRRAHVYKGSISGYATTSSATDPRKFGKTLLRHLYQFLIPPEAMTGFAPDDLLIIVPHQLLHLLPFHALLQPAAQETYLAQQATIIYTPSLHIWQRQLRQWADAKQTNEGAAAEALVCGVTDFGWRAPRLRYVDAEIETLRRLWAGRCQVLWNEGASREAIEELNRSGMLRSYRLLHFATHARFDDASPLQSRILLHDVDLTIPAILDLDLNAQLVTLSACDTALRTHFEGDEMVGLVNALFLAGAQSLLVSLWQTEDRATSELMRRFYTQLKAGESPARALALAQRALISAGYSPYEWAPFVVMGVAIAPLPV